MVEMLTARDRERKIERDAEKRALGVAVGAVAKVAKKGVGRPKKVEPMLAPAPAPPAPKRLRIHGKSTHG